MPMNWEIQLENGLMWAVGSRILHRPSFQTRSQVVIPVEQLGEMTNEEIGKFVREAAEAAQWCHAEEIAYNVLQYDPENWQPSPEDIVYLYQFASKSEDIRKAIDKLNAPRPQKIKAEWVRRPIPGSVYLVTAGPHYKIGCSKNVSVRMSELGIQLPFPFTLIHTIPTSDMYWAEKSLHERFAAKRLNGEWFALDKDDVRWICSLTELEEKK